MRAAGVALAVGLCLAPSAAFACPYCTTRGQIGPAQGLIIGALLSLPFLIGAAIVRFIRHHELELPNG